MKFKNIKKALIVFAAAATLQACTKKEVIELTPEFSLDALSNPSSMKQVEEVLTGAYSRFRGADYYGSGSGTGSGWALMPDVLSDNLYEVTAETLANSRAMADWIYNQSTGQTSSLYSAPYGVIAVANIVLRDIDKFTTPQNQLLANRLKGQAYAIRAMAHFDLLRYFAVKFDRNSTTDLALGYSTEFIVSSEVKPSRLSNKDYYDKLFADINQAITLLGNVDKAINPASGLTRPFIDRNGAYAILARINLYAGNWADAATAATNALNGRPLATTQAAFSGMYNQTNRGEIIWNVQFEAGQSGPTFLVYFVTSARNYFRPAPEIATVAGNTGLIQSNDIRYSAFFSVVGSGGLGLTKYQGKGTATDGNANFPAIRSGEMYLIRAEANARLGGANEAAALADLNALRAARIAGYVPVVLAGPALINAIADERRRELMGEGHRFFDLKRTTRTIQRGAICGTSVSAAGDCSLAPTDREWAMPIHESIRNANPNMAQTLGYN
ncbi:RagB/SusD family nutrient uptake outer membrane protein [Lacibacter sediminis]|uniref:RagB/SusD family nutrient uptake outer membrane protein n=1 Tax=Lacibacter sediminis TaxID=2760713 RepID=A0A7G5XHI6_9BACT|nr:RagB/SusD family nutrient uptake outer membrane protein [Lacibacter sediminis]QNA44939.1 RagB/SusD family nutrient uptake outer membrane protein [Lacibacter sediminis]